MDAALKTMFPRRETCDLELAALKHSSPGHGDLAKSAGTFGNRSLPWPIQLRYEAATEVLDLGKGMRFAALVDYAESGSFRDLDFVRFEIPVRVRMSRLRLGEQYRQRREISQRDVLTEVRPERLVEGGRIALVQGHDLGVAQNWTSPWRICLRKPERRPNEHQTANE